MSYEGYIRVLCNNGHLTEWDYYEYYNSEEPNTCHCGAKFVWRNDVDQTNCEEEKYIIKLEVDKFNRDKKICTYKIPDKIKER